MRSFSAVALNAGAALFLATAAQAQLVRGRVVDVTTREPVEAAQVEISDSIGRALNSTLTNEDGTFRLLVSTNVDPILVGVSAIGYGENPPRMIRRHGDAVLLEIDLHPRPLAVEGLSIRVERQSAHLARSGFYDRAERGIGDHLMPEDLKSIASTRSADLLRRAASIHVLGDEEPIFRRGGVNFNLNCLPAIWLDGILVREGGTPVPFERVAPPPAEIEAIELYPGAASVPVQ